MKPANSAKRLKRAKADARSSKPAKKSKGAGKPNKAGSNKKKAAAKNQGRNAGSLAQARDKANQGTVGTIASAKPTTGRQEIQAASDVIKSGLLGPGTEVQAFERELSLAVGLPEGHAVATASADLALYVALMVLDAPGKKVAMPAYSSSGTRAAIDLARATAVVVDSLENSPHINLEAATTCGAQMAVVSHNFGLPVDLRKFAAKMPVIEDCSQALGAKVGEICVGLQGDAGIYSFASGDLITSGGAGGAVVFKDAAKVVSARRILAALNLAMSDLQAAIGRAQLARLTNFLTRREEIFEEYAASEFFLVDCPEGDLSPVRQSAVLRSNMAEAIVEFLNSGMIQAFIPIAESELAGDAALYPNASDFAATTFAIPIYPHLSNAEVIEIAEQTALAVQASEKSEEEA
jgi:perosamine synthetase